MVVLYFYTDPNIFMCFICAIWTNLCDSVIPPQALFCVALNLNMLDSFGCGAKSLLRFFGAWHVLSAD